MGFFNNLKQTVNSSVATAVSNSKTSVEVGAVPSNIEEFKSRINFQDANSVAAFTIMALCVYPMDKNMSIEMINFLKGPAELSAYDKQFLSDRFMGKEYLALSFLSGTSPENNYTPSEPYTVEVIKTPHSEDAISEGYLQLYVQSSGADSPRGIRMRKKASTGEWFLWEYFVLAGIREPKAADPWA